MIDDADMFDVAAEPAPAGGTVIPFPRLRPSTKLRERWTSELARGGAGLKALTPIDVVGQLVELRKMPRLHWPHGWPRLAERLVTYPGDMNGIVGSQGGGKTSFAIQVCVANAGHGIPTLWWPGELDPPQIVARIAGNMHHVHAMAVRDHWPEERLAHAMAAVTDMWHFVDRALPDVDKQLAIMRQLVKVAWSVYQMPPLLVVDHVGKLANGARDLRVGTAHALEQLRALTVEEKCYTLALSQGSRANQAVLTGRKDVDNATDAGDVAAEARQFEEDACNVVALAIFKADDAEALDGHALITKARWSGKEGREGIRFSKPGGVWSELDYLPATPTQEKAAIEADKRDKHRTEPPRSPKEARADLNAERAAAAEVTTKTRLLAEITRYAAIGVLITEVRKAPGVGRSTMFQRTLAELMDAGQVERVPGAPTRVRAVARNHE